MKVQTRNHEIINYEIKLERKNKVKGNDVGRFYHSHGFHHFRIPISGFPIKTLIIFKI